MTRFVGSVAVVRESAVRPAFPNLSQTECAGLDRCSRLPATDVCTRIGQRLRFFLRFLTLPKWLPRSADPVVTAESFS